MPHITDTPPSEVLADLQILRDALDDIDVIPSKVVDRNLLIATWNIRGFGNLTD